VSRSNEFIPSYPGCGSKCPIEKSEHLKGSEICCDASRTCCYACFEEDCPIKDIYGKEMTRSEGNSYIFIVYFKDEDRFTGKELKGVIMNLFIDLTRHEFKHIEIMRHFGYGWVAGSVLTSFKKSRKTCFHGATTVFFKKNLPSFLERFALHTLNIILDIITYVRALSRNEMESSSSKVISGLISEVLDYSDPRRVKRCAYDASEAENVVVSDLDCQRREDRLLDLNAFKSGFTHRVFRMKETR
jgi:hypothetical protein